MADSVRPVSIMSNAAGAPTSRGRRALPPQPGKMPSLISGSPMRAIAGGHAIAAGQRNFGAATHAEAVDRGDRGAGQFGQALECLLAELDEIGDLPALVEFLQRLEVGAGGERGLGRAHHQALGRFHRDAFQQRLEFQQHVLAEGVHRRVGAIEGQDQHAIVAALDLPVLEAKAVEAVVAGDCSHEAYHPYEYVWGALSSRRGLNGVKCGTTSQLATPRAGTSFRIHGHRVRTHRAHP